MGCGSFAPVSFTGAFYTAVVTYLGSGTYGGPVLVYLLYSPGRSEKIFLADLENCVRGIILIIGQAMLASMLSF
nr:MAG TPA: hypothetical protein [Caudoviricetes sp.]